VDPTHKSRVVRELAAALGFERCGVARAAPIGRADYLASWLRAGNAGSMDYLHRNFATRTNPGELLPGARSAVVVALLYHQPRPANTTDGHACGRVAMYAWGDDYHDVLRAKLRNLVDRMRAEIGEPFESRICVDTAPMIERELAAAAGIGWIGKNTMVLHPELGSYFFLGVVLTTLDLTPDAAMPDHCGTCTACLDACPTQAFPRPYQMDASRCISYLTIEHRGDISRPFQEMMGQWVFGCDVCQEVCPFNRHAPATREPRFAVRLPPLEDIPSWTTEEYRRSVRGSAMSRANLDMFHRNAEIVARNASRRRPSSSQGQGASVDGG
jgi:epoxyqueuosine reductase